MVRCVFGLRPPRNIAHMFGDCSKLGQQKYNLLLLSGVAALCWVIWLTRNDLVFNKCQPKFFLQDNTVYFLLVDGCTLFTLKIALFHLWRTLTCFLDKLSS